MVPAYDTCLGGAPAWDVCRSRLIGAHRREGWRFSIQIAVAMNQGLRPASGTGRRGASVLAVPRLASEQEEQPVSDRPYPIGDPPADYPLRETPDDDHDDEEDIGRTGPFWSCAPAVAGPSGAVRPRVVLGAIR